MPDTQTHVTASRTLEEASDRLAAAAVARMDETLPWYRAMSAESRSWVGLVAQTGIAAFAAWFHHIERAPAVTADVFGAAPRDLARTITLRQTVELVRTTTTVVEEWAAGLQEERVRALLREGILSYSREIAFAAAAVYAQAAETRGAWDARLEALVVDAVVRGDDASVASRAAALGWQTVERVVVVVGHSPEVTDAAEAPSVGTVTAIVDQLRRDARASHVDVLTSTYGDEMVAVLGGSADLVAAARAVAVRFGPGPVVIGPVVDSLEAAPQSAAAALSGLSAAAAWPHAPRPVTAAELLPERALAGDDAARRRLIEEVYEPLLRSTDAIIDTLATYLERAPSMEAAARLLFVHPNTVRYRLQRVIDITGWSATDARGAYVLRLALALGRLATASGGTLDVSRRAGRTRPTL